MQKMRGNEPFFKKNMPNLVLEIAENGRQLHLRRGSVAVMAGEECLGLVPVDSLACVLLTADGIMLSRAFMARMAEEGVPVVICGDNYMPVSVSLPTAPHYRALPVVTAQMRASPVLKKRLWQQCIAAKLRNQGRVLRLCRPESPVADQILALSGKVRSGDTDNKEAPGPPCWARTFCVTRKAAAPTPRSITAMPFCVPPAPGPSAARACSRCWASIITMPEMPSASPTI